VREWPTKSIKVRVHRSTLSPHRDMVGAAIFDALSSGGAPRSPRNSVRPSDFLFTTLASQYHILQILQIQPINKARSTGRPSLQSAPSIGREVGRCECNGGFSLRPPWGFDLCKEISVRSVHRILQCDKWNNGLAVRSLLSRTFVLKYAVS